MDEVLNFTEKRVRGGGSQRSWFVVIQASGWGGENIAHVENRLERKIPVELFFILVEPYFRRRGVATALIRHAMKRAGELGSKELFLTVNASLPHAQHLYERLGFVITGVDGPLKRMAVEIAG